MPYIGSVAGCRCDGGCSLVSGRGAATTWNREIKVREGDKKKCCRVLGGMEKKEKYLASREGKLGWDFEFR